MPDFSRQFDYIAQCQDPAKLKQILANARNANVDPIVDAAFRKLVNLVPGEKPGTLEFDFWRTIHAFEHLLSEERKRTTRLSRTRQKVARVGVRQTLIDWSEVSKETTGFRMLLDRNMADLTGEAIVLRHCDRFDEHTVACARQRLANEGIHQIEP